MQKLQFSREITEIAQCNYEGIDKFIFPSIQELVDFLEKFDTSNCYFRGQSHLWEITSTLHRHHSSKERFKKACNISVSALEWLINNPFISNVLSGNDDYAMAIAQHYGCPTDLVDVTTNFRTAAYFAVSDNEKHAENPNGCIWVFTQNDLRELQNILETNFFGCFEKLPQSLQDKLVKNNYSQVLQIDIPQLSRLNAQNGAFLWDVCGLLTQQLRWRIIGTQFVFKHTPDEKSNFDEEEGKLFPFPNQLESEIMRIFTKKNTTDGLPEFYGAVNVAAQEKEGKLINGMIPEIAEKAKDFVYFDLPDYFTPSFDEYAWTKRKVSQNDFYVKNINVTNYLECRVPFSVEGTLFLVQHILKSVKDNSLTDLLILFFGDDAIYTIPDGEEEYIVEIVITLSNYLYSDFEIATVLFEWLKIMKFLMENEYIITSEEEFSRLLLLGYVNDWVTQYYGCPVIRLYLGENEKMARFWLPKNYVILEHKYQVEFSGFDKGCFKSQKMIQSYCDNLPDNAKIFLYQHKPQKIMPYEVMKKMFIDLILPQHFAFRRIDERVFIPDYIDKITLPVFGRKLFGLDAPIKGDENYAGFVMV